MNEPHYPKESRDTTDIVPKLGSIAELMEDEGIGRGDWCDAPTVRMAMRLIEDQRAELKARREILDAIQAAAGEGWWSGAMGWRQKLRDFAEDTEQHCCGKRMWKLNRGNGIILYAHGGFFTAYYEDAAELWGQADDTLPMFHVMVQSDPPHRTVIHPLHLVPWVEHLARTCLPVQILSGDDLEDDG